MSLKLPRWLLLTLAATALHVSLVTANCPPNDVCDSCGQGATCETVGGNDECQCGAGLESDFPGFDCHNPANEKKCYFIYDPTVDSLNDESVVVHFIGSSKLLEVQTHYKQDSSETCHFEVWGYTTKYNGKLYLKGLVFRQNVQQVGMNAIANTLITGEIYGEDVGCSYEYTTKIESPDNSYLFQSTQNIDSFGEIRAEITGSPTACDIRVNAASGLFVELESPCCGVRFGIRVHHPDYKARIPGAYFKVKNSYSPTYPMWNLESVPLCLDGTNEVNFTNVIDKTGISNKKSAMVFLSITNSPFAEYNERPPALLRLKDVLGVCNLESRQELFERGGFMFHNWAFINCIATDDIEYIEFLADAVTYICEQDPVYCTYLNNTMATKCDHVKDKIPGLYSFVEGPCIA